MQAVFKYTMEFVNSMLKNHEGFLIILFFCFSICFEWACQDFLQLTANLGPLCMPHPGMGPLV